MPLPIEETIADLANSSKPLPSSRLTGLANLKSEEAKLLEQAWAAIKPTLRRQTISQLVKLAEDNIELNFDSIFSNCLKDADAEVRSKAIEGLWESEDASLINPLIRLLEQDSSKKVQTVSATALGKFAMLAELKKLRSSYTSKIEQALLTAIGDKTKFIEVRCRALKAVASLSLPRVRRAIMEAYKSRNSKLKISAIYAMGRNCDHSWLPILLRELASADAEICYEATQACGELGEEEAVPYLIELINDADDDVALTAIQALGKIGGSEAKGCLEQCLNNSKDLIHRAVEQALDELRADEAPFSFRV